MATLTLPVPGEEELRMFANGPPVHIGLRDTASAFIAAISTRSQPPWRKYCLTDCHAAIVDNAFIARRVRPETLMLRYYPGH